MDIWSNSVRCETFHEVELVYVRSEHVRNLGPTAAFFIRAHFMECSDEGNVSRAGNVVVSGSVAAAQTATAPRIDGEGINMDAPPPPTREPSHPADGYAPKASNPSAATTGQAPTDDRFPADRGDTRPVPNAPK